MKILVASDSFKGTMSSREIGRIVQQELAPAHQVDYLPVSDGGEGFLDSLQGLYPGQLRQARSQDPLGREIICQYILSDDKTAIIESAVTVGLGLLAESERNPMNAGTYGLGLLIGDGLRQGAERVYIGLGGSAVNDGGAGLLTAMGVGIFDKSGVEIKENGGKVLNRIAALDTSALDSWIQAASFYAVCDVDNPLLGPRGATRVYGPQKGADPAMVESLEEGMTIWAEVVKRETGQDDADVPGAGAAGGLGFCLKSCFNARLIRGIDAQVDLTGLEGRISQYDLIITGEGKLDRQTKSGKVPLGMLRLGEKYHIPVVCLCGLNESTGDMGFKKVFSIVPQHASYVESIAAPELSLLKLIRDEVIHWIDSEMV
ncbi:MAG: glycerate kinase [Bacteroidota bacterium]